MFSVLVSLLVICENVAGKLVVDSLADLMIGEGDDKVYDALRVVSEGDMINKTLQESECPGVMEEIQLWEVFTMEKGKEVSNMMEVAKLIDLISDTMQISNSREPWVKGSVIIRPYLNCFEQDAEFVINALRNDHLRPPSTEKYNFSSPNNDVSIFGQYGQPVYLDMVIFKGQVKHGFFIEAGADDFETDSNTILFEMKHKWGGLLVEPNPTIYPKGFTKQRKAWASSSCLATEPRPHVVPFSQKTVDGGMSGIVMERNKETYDMQCFPLYSLLMAIGNRTVNYLSLDIEGAEFLVLQTIPWDRVDIEVMTIETNHAGEVFPGSKQDIRDYLADKGYVYAHTVEIDDVFIRKDLYEGKYKPDLEKQAEFYKLIGDNCSMMTDIEQLEEYIQYLSSDDNFKIEL